MTIDILAISTTIITLGGAVTYLSKAIKPINDMKKKHEEYERYFNEDKSRLNKIEESNGIMFRTLLALVSHEINGNSIDKLKSSRDEINEFLTNSIKR